MENNDITMDVNIPSAQFILMRNDLESLNPGKAMAQAAHASNALDKFLQENFMRREFNGVWPSYEEWMRQTDSGFGICLVYEPSDNPFIDAWPRIERFINSISWPKILVFDPSYPIRDGSVTHLIPLHTCAAFFAPYEEGRKALSQANFVLHH